MASLWRGGIIPVSLPRPRGCAMPDFLLREVDPALLDFFRQRAEANGRSLQAEIKKVLRDNAKYTKEEWLEVSQRWREQTRGRSTVSAAELIREDRDR
jgi:hypothetical protein